MAFGQSFAVYKLVQTAAKAACNLSGSSDRTAESVSTYAGAYVQPALLRISSTRTRNRSGLSRRCPHPPPGLYG
jgi:hypothetical protein